MTRHSYTALILLFWAASGAAVAQAPGASTGASGQPPATGTVAQGTLLPVTVPFTISNGLVTVKSSIGDGLLQTSAIATAIPVSVVQPEIGRKQSLRTDGVKDVPTLYGPLRGAGLQKQLLRVDQITMTDVPFAMVDVYGGLSSKSMQDPPMIWLGGSFLGAFQFTIDDAKKQIVFRAAGTALPKKATVVPFELQDGRIYVQVKLNDHKPVPALVDTCSVGTLLPADVGKSLKLTSLATFTAQHPNGKQGKVCAVELKELALGGAKAKGVEALYISEGDAAGLDTGPVILGTDVLLRYRVTIDYSLRKMALEEIASKAPAPVAEQQPAARPRAAYPSTGIDPRFTPRRLPGLP